MLSEVFKKNTYYTAFAGESPHMQLALNYSGAKRSGYKPGMRNIAIYGSGRFSVLVAFELKLWKWTFFHTYGFVQSNAEGVAVISTYMGQGATRFLFLVNDADAASRFVVSSTAADQSLTPQQVYEPHWWQRWLGKLAWG